MIVNITHSRDAETNDDVVSVQLYNIDKQCILYRDDFDRLIATGVTPLWKYTVGQVYPRGKNKPAIARLICGAMKNEKIKYRDKDSCNLRRDNLQIVSGKWKESKFKLNHVFIPPPWEVPSTSELVSRMAPWEQS